MKTEERVKAKSAEVTELAKEIQNFGSFLVFEYLGLSAGEISNLRKKLRESDSKLVIYKNNILNRAIEKIEIKTSTGLKGPNAILLTKNDIKPFKEVISIAKDKDFLKLKLAYFDKEVIEKDNLKLLSSLGSKEDLLVKFSQTVMSPLYKFLFLLKQIHQQ